MATAEVAAGERVEAGELPSWRIADLPAPPAFSLRGILQVIGPSAILLGTSIGSGEWLIGPGVTARFGAALLWVATISILLQTFLNLEFGRYTLYTGEPVYTGFMRTKPGRFFWGPVYFVMMFLQLGWPGWALSAATALAAIVLGKQPGQVDAATVAAFGFVTFFITVAIAAFGSKIEQTMEIVEWIMIALILVFLLYVGLFLVSPQSWGRVAAGFVSFGSRPPVNETWDWALIGGFAAYAGAGGVINGAISNWMRDKGFGMAKVVGYIPAIIGGRKVNLSHEGAVFRPTPQNLRNWREWWKFMNFEQWVVFCIGAFLGMGLPALVTVQFIPPQTNIMGSTAVATFQAEGLRRVGGDVLWVLTLLTGFWILFSTQLGITDGFVRMVTDLVWTGSGFARGFRGGDVRYVYYGAMIVFLLWGSFLLASGIRPGLLILTGANIAGFNFVVLSLHQLYLNRRFLPPELRPSLWREIILVATALFFSFFTIATFLSIGDKPFGLPTVNIKF
ncbi:MAG TPA: Nramp family divalent metal transporter [Candidatus Dormibacteraeota bacterium]|nr:Nramp family divalent metal transporter [Candidatus Dormibacteraeota bacterium]